jgi:hypothetical protein
MGAGEYSLEQVKKLHANLDKAVDLLSDLQQPDHPDHELTYEELDTVNNKETKCKSDIKRLIAEIAYAFDFEINEVKSTGNNDFIHKGILWESCRSQDNGNVIRYLYIYSNFKLYKVYSLPYVIASGKVNYELESDSSDKILVLSLPEDIKDLRLVLDEFMSRYSSSNIVLDYKNKILENKYE